MDSGTQGGDLRRTLRKSHLANDLIAAMTPPGATGIQADAGTHQGWAKDASGTISVIIEGNAKVPGGGSQARDLIALRYARERGIAPADPMLSMLRLPPDSPGANAIRAGGAGTPDTPLFRDGDRLELRNSLWTDQYLFGRLTPNTILALSGATFTIRVRRAPDPLAPPDAEPVFEDKVFSLVHKLWLNHDVSRFVYESVRTVKCDAARAAFAAGGEGVVWAVADTGIDGGHHHFRTHATLSLPDGLQHMDFTPAGDPLRDDDGHGTHVAGIIAGQTVRRPAGSDDKTLAARLRVRTRVRTSDTAVDEVDDDSRAEISGVAPRCKLVSLKVLQTGQAGDVGTLLAALGYIQKANDYGRNLRIHGVNLSLGYNFDARWFAAGQSPLCAEVDRLVRSGVVVVVAAGNSGYGTVQSLDRTTERASHLATISDPGNADLAITIGSTHRDSPHSYGVSYFSAKGPTADGRMKPDLVAPGERIVSAMRIDPEDPEVALFREDTGTSMAAPHVSGAIAAFLSVRREFRGRPEEVKRIFMGAATDLRRRPEYQGAGLIDVMRALQSV